LAYCHGRQNKEVNKNETWTIVNLLQNKIAMRNAWVGIKTNYKTGGNIDKFNANLVNKLGCLQKYGIMKHFHQWLYTNQ